MIEMYKNLINSMITWVNKAAYWIWYEATTQQILVIILVVILLMQTDKYLAIKIQDLKRKQSFRWTQKIQAMKESQKKIKTFAKSE